MILRGTTTIRQLTGTRPANPEEPVVEVLVWATNEVRHGSLARPVYDFLKDQAEFCDPSGVVVESVSREQLICCARAISEDREARSPFETEIRFGICPVSGRVQRL